MPPVKPQPPTVTCVADTRCLLGEGPLWDAGRQCLWWVDIKRARLHRWDGAKTTTLDLGVPLTALTLDGDGGLHGACADGVGQIDVDANRFTLTRPFPEEPVGNRSNDGKVDATGAFWVGTMDDAEGVTSGSVWRLADTIERHASGFHVPNGPAFDRRGAMYLTDSARQTIYRFDEGRPHDAREPHVFARFGEAEGYPDGMTVDAEDHLWVAFWDGWCVRRLSPAGHVVAEYALPVQRPTCPVFGGPDLATLFVTSASIGLNAEAWTHQPQAGGVFALDGMGVGGVAAHPFVAR